METNSLTPILFFLLFIAVCAYSFYLNRCKRLKHENEALKSQLRYKEDDFKKIESNFLKHKKEAQQKIQFAIENKPKFNKYDLVGNKMIIDIDIDITPKSVIFANAVFRGLHIGTLHAAKMAEEEIKNRIFYKYKLVPDNFNTLDLPWTKESRLLQQKEAEERLKKQKSKKK